MAKQYFCIEVDFDNFVFNPYTKARNFSWQVAKLTAPFTVYISAGVPPGSTRFGGLMVYQNLVPKTFDMAMAIANHLIGQAVRPPDDPSTYTVCGDTSAVIDWSWFIEYNATKARFHFATDTILGFPFAGVPAGESVAVQFTFMSQPAQMPVPFRNELIQFLNDQNFVMNLLCEMYKPIE